MAIVLEDLCTAFNRLKACGYSAEMAQPGTSTVVITQEREGRSALQHTVKSHGQNTFSVDTRVVGAKEALADVTVQPLDLNDLVSKVTSAARSHALTPG